MKNSDSKVTEVEYGQRDPTNTLIITKAELLMQEPQPLIDLLYNNGLIAEMVTLPKLDRILVVCQTESLAQEASQLVKGEWPDLSVTYSFLSLDQSVEENNQNNQQLQVPEDTNARRFLILPPALPPPEWDHWHRVEEGPHPHAIYDPEDMAHMLWERLGGFDSSMVRRFRPDLALDLDLSLDADVDLDTNLAKYLRPPSKAQSLHDFKQHPEILFSGIKDNMPAIMLDTVSGQQTERQEPLQETRPFARTSLPPTK